MRAWLWRLAESIEAALWHPIYLNRHAPEWLQFHGYRFCNWVPQKSFAAGWRGPS